MRNALAVAAASASFLMTVTVIAVLVSRPFAPVYAAAQRTNQPPPKHGSVLTAVGNRVLSADGRPYIPEGISVYGGLEDSDYARYVANDKAQMIAASRYWHANTIRLQVAESNLFSGLKPGAAYNKEFLRHVVAQVAFARKLGMAVVINDQTEFTSKIPDPTTETARFWNVMSQAFGNQPYVIFDLFNEPKPPHAVAKHRHSGIIFNRFLIPKSRRHAHHKTRKSSRNQLTSAQIWKLWEYGGTVYGVHYLGMQTLVNQIRNRGVNNLVWVEGPHEARELPDTNHLIKGSNIVYSIHHPNLNSPASWNRLGALSSIRPVVDGEWSQYQSPWAECYSKAYTNAPLYLSYLRKHHVGLIAWSLQAGSLVRGNRLTIPSNVNKAKDPKKAISLKRPSRLLPSYRCGHTFGQGAGQLIQAYFAKNSQLIKVL